MEIDTRTQHLLKALINHHVADGQPVGTISCESISFDSMAAGYLPIMAIFLNFISISLSSGYILNESVK